MKRAMNSMGPSPPREREAYVYFRGTEKMPLPRKFGRFRFSVWRSLRDALPRK